ncbi:carbon-nitrogen family hydrolase [Staphylococcus canis]|uniref:Carbon-nitrogen family hydrolase n=1 Tax=Staphylococcus canis TaxID=2724942 RepID=A0ABS0T7T1_9STAP|nr:carbon-nitrogen family hydrolase [Staphylococcus canis]MBI5974791.1 carbon-nitrogen family hydrolase [Staphylococcus canis]
MKIQLFQFKVEPAQADQNKAKIEALFEKHVDDTVDVVVLPEMWNNGYALPSLNELADHKLEDSLPFIQSLAQKYHVDIIGGSVSNHHEQQLFNTAFAVNQNGEQVYEYNKIHLVPMLDEPTYLDGGNKVPYSFKLSSGTDVSQIICYDLRFPEISRYPAASGSEILFYVAQWPTPRLNHWRALLQARAIENDAFVVATNSCGNDGKTDYAGHSMVVSPNGEIIEEADEQESVLTVTIDTSEVSKQRQAIPVFDNMRPDTYRYAQRK